MSRAFRTRRSLNGDGAVVFQFAGKYTVACADSGFRKSRIFGCEASWAADTGSRPQATSTDPVSMAAILVLGSGMMSMMRFGKFGSRVLSQKPSKRENVMEVLSCWDTNLNG